MTRRPPWGEVLLRRDHVLVLGLPGCGKTPFGAALAATARRAVFFDAAGEWGDQGRRVTVDELAAAPRRVLAGTYCRVVVEPDPQDVADDFLTVVDACREAAPHGGLVLLADEVGDLSEDYDASIALRGLHRNGHKDGIATVLCSPCWTDFPARCRSTASRVYSFAQRAEADVRALNAELGRHVPGFGDLAAAWRYPAPPVTYVSPNLHR